MDRILFKDRARVAIGWHQKCHHRASSFGKRIGRSLDFARLHEAAPASGQKSVAPKRMAASDRARNYLRDSINGIGGR